jgi:2-polyprenyl-3-methyl-5-hydroxy-6-metoxy-1,4-benzoquinol methylase
MNYLDVYKKCFSFENYSNCEHIQYNYVINNIKKLNLENNNIIEIGSGKGHILLKILDEKKNLKNLKLTSVDLDNFHNIPVDNFFTCNLSNESERNKLLENKYDILVCTDVYEHLDKSFIESVIEICSKISTYSILAIANHSDIWNDVELHTIQENDIWWDNILNKYFNIIQKETHYNGRLYMYIVKSNFNN